MSASASTTSQDSASEESAAESSLKWQVDHDRPSVTKDLTGKWVAQLSSKKPGMTADGMTWDNRTTLQEFLKLRQKYPTAKLLYSEDWPVFDAGGKYWVTIAGTPVQHGCGGQRLVRRAGIRCRALLRQVHRHQRALGGDNGEQVSPEPARKSGRARA